jgi:hypothetical protein
MRALGIQRYSPPRSAREGNRRARFSPNRWRAENASPLRPQSLARRERLSTSPRIVDTRRIPLRFAPIFSMGENTRGGACVRPRRRVILRGGLRRIPSPFFQRVTAIATQEQSPRPSSKAAVAAPCIGAEALSRRCGALHWRRSPERSRRGSERGPLDKLASTHGVIPSKRGCRARRGIPDPFVPVTPRAMPLILSGDRRLVGLTRRAARACW